MKQLILFFFVLILLVPIVYSQLPFSVQVFTGDNSLTILYPPNGIIEQNIHHTFEFHVLNSSSGVPITSNIGCVFHLTDDTGEHIAELFTETVEHDYAYIFIVNESNFTNTGDFAYLTVCNGTNAGGGVEVGFKVTADGKDDAVIDNTAGIAVTLFLVLFNLAFFIIPITTRLSKNSFADFILRRCMILMGMFVLSLNFGTMATIADNSNLDVLRTLFRYLWLINWSIYLGMLYIFYSGTQQAMKLWHEIARNKRMGDEDEED